MVEKSQGITLAEYQRAYRKMRAGQEKIGFLVHFTAYVVVNSLLITINLRLVPGFIWFVFPLIGWGIGLTMHYTFAVRLLDRFLRAEETRAERLAEN